MAERERISLGNGVALFRQYETWSIEVCRDRRRIRKSLRTKDKAEALMNAALELKPAPAPPNNFVHFLSEQDHKQKRAVGPEALLRIEHIQPYADPLVTLATALKTLGLSGLEMKLPDSKNAAVPIETARTEFITFLRNTKRDKEPWIHEVEKMTGYLVNYAKLPFLADYTTSVVEGYISSIASKAPRTVKQRLMTYRAWFGWAVEVKKYLTNNPALPITPPRIRQGKIHYHTYDQIERLLEAARGSRLEDLIITALYSGMRESELFMFERERDTDLKARTIRVRYGGQEEGEGTKADKWREVALMEELLPVIARMHRQGRAFPFTQSGAFYREINRIYRKAGLPMKKYEKGLQVLRHYPALRIMPRTVRRPG